MALEVSQIVRLWCLQLLLAITVLTPHTSANRGTRAPDINKYGYRKLMQDTPCGGMREKCCQGGVCGAPELTCRVLRCRPCGGKLDPICEYPGMLPCKEGLKPIGGACFSATDSAGQGSPNADLVAASPPLGEAPEATAPESAAPESAAPEAAATS